MRSWIRASWFAELNSQDPQMRSLGAVRTIAELVMLGYPLPLLKRVVGGITQQPVRGLRGTTLRYLHALRRKYRDQPPPEEEVREDLHDMHMIPEARWSLLAEQQSLSHVPVNSVP